MSSIFVGAVNHQILSVVSTKANISDRQQTSYWLKSKHFNETIGAIMRAMSWKQFQKQINSNWNNKHIIIMNTSNACNSLTILYF